MSKSMLIIEDDGGSRDLLRLVWEYDGLQWSEAEDTERLRGIMSDIHDECVEHGVQEGGHVDYLKGANIAGFTKVANAMLAYGVM